MRLSIAAIRTVGELKLDVGDELVLVSRVVVSSVAGEVVDVTGFQADQFPEVTIGERTVELEPQRLEVVHVDEATPKSVVEAAERAGVKLS